MSRPILSIINLSALSQNLNIVRNYAKKTKIWSVIKANGYGHSLKAVYNGLKDTDGFALLDINDAISLRKYGWKGPILLLGGFFHKSDLNEINHYNLTTIVHSEWQIEAIKNMPSCNKPINIYVKLNSGMNRLGFNYKILKKVWETLSSLKQVSSLTLMSHFSCTNKSESIDSQMQIIKKVSNMLEQPHLLCLANSASFLWYPKTHADWVRTGIILYGAFPNGDWKNATNIGLKPAMTLQSELIAIQNVSHGCFLGYGNYKLHKSKTIGIVACGYADGYPRNAPVGTPVLVDDIKTSILGTVSMDTLMVDLQPCPLAKIGSKVELWGNKLKIDEVASFIGTVGYELMSTLSSRVKIKIIHKTESK